MSGRSIFVFSSVFSLPNPRHHRDIFHRDILFDQGLSGTSIHGLGIENGGGKNRCLSYYHI